VEVANCFAVPHAKRGYEVAIGKYFNKQMLALHLRANHKEVVLGWYASAALGKDGADSLSRVKSRHVVLDPGVLLFLFFFLSTHRELAASDFCLRTVSAFYSMEMERWTKDAVLSI
jgi:hypothetical protein